MLGTRIDRANQLERGSDHDRDGSAETVALNPAGGGLHGYGWTHIVPLNGAEDVFWQAAITDPAGAIRHSPCAMTRV